MNFNVRCHVCEAFGGWKVHIRIWKTGKARGIFIFNFSTIFFTPPRHRVYCNFAIDDSVALTQLIWISCIDFIAKCSPNFRDLHCSRLIIETNYSLKANHIRFSNCPSFNNIFHFQFVRCIQTRYAIYGELSSPTNVTGTGRRDSKCESDQIRAWKSIGKIERKEIKQILMLLNDFVWFLTINCRILIKHWNIFNSEGKFAFVSQSNFNVRLPHVILRVIEHSYEL